MANLERKMEISVLCIPGIDMKVEDNFFINGRAREWLDPSIINYVDNNSSSYGLYAVSTDMEADHTPGMPNLSAVKALKRFKERTVYESVDTDKKNEVLKNELLDVFKYVTEKNFSDVRQEQLTDEKSITSPSAACVHIENGQAAITTIGKAKVYKYNNGYMETYQYRQKQIFNKEQISVMSPEGAKGIKVEEEYPVYQTEQKEIKDNDIFILCTGASSEHVEQELIREIFSSPSDIAEMCGEILKPALMDEEEKDLSVMIIKCGKTEKEIESDTLTQFDDEYDVEKHIKISSILAIVFACITCLLIGTLVGRAISNSSAKPSAADSVKTAEVTQKIVTYATQSPKTNANATQPAGSTASLPSPTADTNSSGTETYTIKADDTLEKISELYYNDKNKWQKIVDANPGLNPNSLSVGRKIKIPK